jgi:TetR/AcrR family transcriptional regulator
MVEEINTTESQIFEAALKVFHKKGLAGARMQEIADEAGINKSMLHYYFRSKEQLFKQVFMQSFRRFIGSIVPLLNEENTWEEKIPLIIEHYAQVMQANPDLALFVINELRQNPEGFLNVVKNNSFLDSVFISQLRQAIQNGLIRPVPPIQIWISIVSGIVFPFIAAPMIKLTVSIQDTNWESFITDRKRIVADMLISYLKAF